MNRRSDAGTCPDRAIAEAGPSLILDPLHMPSAVVHAKMDG
jgi:hypothetical protein